MLILKKGFLKDLNLKISADICLNKKRSVFLLKHAFENDYIS